MGTNQSRIFNGKIYHRKEKHSCASTLPARIIKKTARSTDVQFIMRNVYNVYTYILYASPADRRRRRRRRSNDLANTKTDVIRLNINLIRLVRTNWFSRET